MIRSFEARPRLFGFSRVLVIALLCAVQLSAPATDDPLAGLDAAI